MHVLRTAESFTTELSPAQNCKHNATIGASHPFAMSVETIYLCWCDDDSDHQNKIVNPFHSIVQFWFVVVSLLWELGAKQQYINCESYIEWRVSKQSQDSDSTNESTVIQL